MIPLIEILFFIAVNLVPADVPSFSIMEHGTNTTQFIRGKDGGWEVKEAKEHRGTWYLKKTTVSVETADGGSETDVSQVLTIPVNPDWHTLKELDFGGTKIRIERQDRGGKVSFVDGRKTAQHQIKWPESRK